MSLACCLLMSFLVDRFHYLPRNTVTCFVIKRYVRCSIARNEINTIGRFFCYFFLRAIPIISCSYKDPSETVSRNYVTQGAESLCKMKTSVDRVPSSESVFVLLSLTSSNCDKISLKPDIWNKGIIMMFQAVPVSDCSRMKGLCMRPS